MQIATIRTMVRPTGEVKCLLVHLEGQYLPTRCDSLEAAGRYAEGYVGVWASALDVAKFYGRVEAWAHQPASVTGITVRYLREDGTVAETGVSRFRG
jgi:hypothetical protein